MMVLLWLSDKTGQALNTIRNAILFYLKGIVKCTVPWKGSNKYLLMVLFIFLPSFLDMDLQTIVNAIEILRSIIPVIFANG